MIRISTGRAYDLYLESYHLRGKGKRIMPRKYELTYQRGGDGRSGRWKKFYRGKAHYLGAGRSKSDIESYRTALETWKKQKVQLDAELIPVPRTAVAEEAVQAPAKDLGNVDQFESPITRPRPTLPRPRSQLDRRTTLRGDGQVDTRRSTGVAARGIPRR